MYFYNYLYNYLGNEAQNASQCNYKKKNSDLSKTGNILADVTGKSRDK